MSLIVDITKQYKNFSLTVKFNTSESSVGILGASGCGKSLTLKAIAGIITPDSGRIVLNDKVLFDSEKKINLPPQKRKVGYLFQNYALFPNMTVEQNIGVGIHTDKKEKAIQIRKMIKAFYLSGLEKQYPSQLSGGQQQRVALARILASDTDILLLDEPFSALDYFLKEQLKEQLFESIKNYEKDVILVTHDRDEAFSLCNELMIMDEGHLVCNGKLKDIFSNPQYLVAARLTGCKNISKARKLSEHEVYASDWDVKLSVEQEVPDGINYVGIRAHYLRPADINTDTDRNLIEPELITVMENPFEINVIIKNKHSSDHTDNNKIWWKLTKEQWFNEWNSMLPKFIELPAEHILLMKE